MNTKQQQQIIILLDFLSMVYLFQNVLFIRPIFHLCRFRVKESWKGLILEKRNYQHRIFIFIKDLTLA